MGQKRVGAAFLAMALVVSLATTILSPRTVGASITATARSNGLNPLTTTRIVDTRYKLGATGPVPGLSGISLRVAGIDGVPDSGVEAVVLNVTVTAPGASGYLSAYPDGGSRPSTSNLNFSRGQTIANQVVAGVGADGKVDVYNGSTAAVELVVDLSGWYAADSAAIGGGFNSLEPSRILDTRLGMGHSGPVAAGADVELHVEGAGGVPGSGVEAVALNVTVTGPRSSGYLTVFPGGASRPPTSNLNFVAGQTIANLIVTKVGPSGDVNVYNGSGSTVQMVADVSGWYATGSTVGAGGLDAVVPLRLADTRKTVNTAATTAAASTNGAVAPGTSMELQVDGVDGVPASGVEDVQLNIAVTQPTSSGYLAVFPDGLPKPGTSNLNFVAGQTIATSVVAQVGSDGKVDLYNGSPGTVQLIADISGWYTPSSLPIPGTFKLYHGIYSPGSIVVGSDGNLWFTSSGVIFRSSPTGVVTSFTGTDLNPGGITSGPDGALWFFNSPINASTSIGRITTDGTITYYPCPGLDDPDEMTVGPDGALWFTNYAANDIGRVSMTGVCTFYQDPRIRFPLGIAAGSDGALWFTNSGNNTIGRITIAGAVTAFQASAGLGPQGNLPQWITAGPDGALWYTTDGTDSAGAIVRMTTDGTITTAYTASTGLQLWSPGPIIVGPDGAVWYISDLYELSRVNPDGSITSYPAANLFGIEGLVAGPNGALWMTNRDGQFAQMTTDGTTTVYQDPVISAPAGIAQGPDGNMWFTDSHGGSIGRINPTEGTVTSYAVADTASLGYSSPIGITAGPDGNMWFANWGDNTIGRVTMDGVVTSYSGTGIDEPEGITVGPDGALWFTNSGNDSIGRITTDGVVTNFPGTGAGPWGIAAGPDGALWYTNSAGGSIGRITVTGAISTFTGPHVSGPTGITLGPDGAMWFMDMGNETIGRIAMDGSLNSINIGVSANGIGITFGRDGALWLGSTNGQLVRVTTDGAVSTYDPGALNGIDSVTTGPEDTLWLTSRYGNVIGEFTPPS